MRSQSKRRDVQYKGRKSRGVAPVVRGKVSQGITIWKTTEGQGDGHERTRNSPRLEGGREDPATFETRVERQPTSGGQNFTLRTRRR